MTPRHSGLPMIALLALLAWASAEPAHAAEPGPVYVIPVRGMIERGLVYLVRRGVGQALDDNASAVILDMDTPGGRLDATAEIINIISDIEIPTYTYVNMDAISAGAIIALATDTIYMAPGSRIGDAMPIMMSPLPMGGPQAIPDDLKEKAVSPTVALIRSAAERNGHDPDLAEAMVRIEYEYTVGDEVICPAGQLLTLTDREAARRVGEGDAERPLLSRGTVESFDDLLVEIDAADREIVRIKASSAETIARVIEGFPMSGLLLAAGLLCIYIEFKTPGLGLPGLLGVLLLGLWFWGHHIAGLAGMGEIVLFLLGVALLMVEIFFIPGFGVTGVAGMACIILSLVLAMVEHYPGGPWYPPRIQVERMVRSLGVGLLVAFGGGALLARILPATPAFQRLMLLSATGRDKGYTASAPTDNLVGLTGVAQTDLRPSGIGQFGKQRLDVVARGEFIDRGTPIVVAETHGNRIVVEPSRPDTNAADSAMPA